MLTKETWGKWHVLEEDRLKIAKRDIKCVYCRKRFNNNSSKLKETVEHIENETWKKNPPLITDIAICCASCNASKGTKKLMDWLDSDYCKEKKINKGNVASIIKRYIENEIKTY